MSLYYYFPLEPKEFEALRKGKLVIKHYHPEFDPYKMLIIVAWNREILSKDEVKNRFHDVLAAGIDVANIPVTEENLRKLEATDDGYEVHYGNFDILLVSLKTFLTVQKEKIAG